jgi:hypothetical protein
MANYGGKQPNNTAYVKNFVYGSGTNLWKAYTFDYSGTQTSAIAPSSTNYENLYIPGDLYVDGSIINPSDKYLKDNIEEIDLNNSEKLMNLKASKFTFRSDPSKHIHYGFIAQDFENDYPELVCIKPDKELNNIKAINYLEIIPLLVSKIQMMQKEIDELKNEIKGSNK